MLCCVFFCANICLSVWFEKWSKWKKWREKRNKRSVFVLSPAIFVYFYLICLVSVLCEAHKIRATQPHNICVEFSKLCAPNKKSNKLYWARCVCLAPAIVFLVLLLIVIQLRFFLCPIVFLRTERRCEQILILNDLIVRGFILKQKQNTGAYRWPMQWTDEKKRAKKKQQWNAKSLLNKYSAATNNENGFCSCPLLPAPLSK